MYDDTMMQIIKLEKERQELYRLASHRSEEHTSELQSLTNLVCRLLLEKKKKKLTHVTTVSREHTEPNHNTLT